MREKVGKSRKHCVFPMICGSGGSKSRLAKAAVRSQLARWEMKKCTPLWREAHFEVKMLKTPGVRTTFGSLRCRKKCTPLWREAHFQVKMYKTHQVRTTFGSWDVEKVHAVVARSTFRSQNVKNTRGSDHFWKLRCRKSARRCGAKHISKSKMYKTPHVRATLEVQMSKKCTPLWREAHFEVKMLKTLQVRTTFGGSDVASPLRFTTLHYVYITPHSTILHYITLHYTPQHYNYTTRLHSTTLKLHYTTLHYTTLHSTTLH